MNYIKMISLALLSLAFYAQGIFSDNAVFIWGGHIVALFTVVYGYIKLYDSEKLKLSTTGRKAYGIFDLLVTIGLFYFLFHISYFVRYSAVESFLLISAIVLIIVGKIIYYYRKEFSTQMVNEN